MVFERGLGFEGTFTLRTLKRLLRRVIPDQMSPKKGRYGKFLDKNLYEKLLACDVRLFVGPSILMAHRMHM